jgi:hypothetical protein
LDYTRGWRVGSGKMGLSIGDHRVLVR